MTALGVSAAIFLLSAAIGVQEKTCVIGSAVLCAVYMLILYLMNEGKGKARQYLRATFLLIIVAEFSVSAYIGFKVSTDYWYDITSTHGDVQELLSLRQRPDNDFYRTEILDSQTYNDPSLYNYNGLAIYSSTFNPVIFDFMYGLGMPISLLGGNEFVYNEISPLLNAFLSLRYVISQDGAIMDNSFYLELAGSTDELRLLENERCLPLGFMADKQLADYKRNSNPFRSQNNFFSRATGLPGDLFTITELTNDPRFPERDYIMPSDGMLYFFGKVYDSDWEEVNIYLNGEPFSNAGVYKYYYSEMVPIGRFSKNDVISFSTDAKKPLLCTGLFNPELFEQGYDLLASRPLRLTKFTQTEVRGNVTALDDGLLYTSIPANKNWSVYVDGVKSKMVLIDNAMSAVRLDKGSHEIEFRYFNKSFLAGIIISLVSLGIFITLIVLKKRDCALCPLKSLAD
jgi:uncharacterized membrane protein YfhO